MNKKVNVVVVVSVVAIVVVVSVVFVSDSPERPKTTTSGVDIDFFLGRKSEVLMESWNRTRDLFLLVASLD